MSLPFVGGTNTASSVNSSTQRTINWIPEGDQHAKYPMRLIPRPGLATFGNAGSSEVRGTLRFNDNGYAVVGGDVKKTTPAGIVTTVGTLSTTTGTVEMVAGRSQFMIVDGVNGYYSDGVTVSVIVDADFDDTATSVTWMDTYFIVNNPSVDGQASRSDTNDASSWNALNFANAERSPDKLLAVATKGRELWMMGEYTIEPFYNDGSDGFSFVPHPAFTEVGLAAVHSVAKGGGLLFWLGKAEEGVNAVFAAAGLQGERISTEAIENDIANAGDTSTAIGDVIYYRGHLMYILTLPSKTLVWDYQTKLWHEWKTYLLDRFRGQHFFQMNNKLYCGDYQDGNIWYLDPESYSDNGIEIERIRRDRHIFSPDLRGNIRHKSLELEFESGVGDYVTEPLAALRWSDDGGHHWSNAKLRGIGKTGKYGTRSVFRSLGTSRDRIYEAKITDKVKAVMTGSYLDAGV